MQQWTWIPLKDVFTFIQHEKPAVSEYFTFFIRKLMGDGWMDGDCINMKVTNFNQRKYSMIEWYCPNTVNQMTQSEHF